jgi:hypothetical protein
MVCLAAPLVKQEAAMPDQSTSLRRRTLTAMDDINIVATFFVWIMAVVGQFILWIREAPTWAIGSVVFFSILPSLVLARRLMRAVSAGQVAGIVQVPMQQGRQFRDEAGTSMRRMYKEFYEPIMLAAWLTAVMAAYLVLFFGLRLIAWLFGDVPVSS